MSSRYSLVLLHSQISVWNLVNQNSDSKLRNQRQLYDFNLILYCTYASNHVTETPNHITRSYHVLR